jgi:hypothetical protein
MHTLEQLRRGELAGSTRLQLACGLTDFPREIFALADTLEILDLSGNALSSLPDDLPRLHKLRIIFCSDNQFAVLPEVLGACASLTMIGFKANRIGAVPAAALPPALRWLVLTDNRIADAGREPLARPARRNGPLHGPGTAAHRRQRTDSAARLAAAAAAPDLARLWGQSPSR